MKTRNNVKKFAGMALILFVVLALISCSSPSNGTSTTGTGPGPNPGLSKLSVTINRNDTLDGSSEFVFRAAHPAGTDSYSVSSGTASKKDSPFTGVGITGAAGLTGAHSNPVATFTVTARNSSVPQDTSLATKVPGMLKYTTTTKGVDGLTDWFKFLDVTLQALADAGNFDYFSHTSIHGIAKVTVDATFASLFYGSADETAANAAMTTILNNWNGIYTSLTGANKNTVDQTLPRIWFNKVPTDTAAFKTVMLNWFKANYDVNDIS